jgi:hypothetical protein
MDENSSRRDPLPWTLFSSTVELAVVVPAFSPLRPSSASFDRPEPHGPLRLELEYDDGSALAWTMARSSEDAEATVAAAASVVIVEEDASAPKGRRHAYVAYSGTPHPRPGRLR